jgi:hypothetical protein
MYPSTPPAVVTLAELAELFNACARRCGEPEKWDRWKTRRMVEGAFGVQFRQAKGRGKLYLTVFELRESGLWDAIRQADARARLGA